MNLLFSVEDGRLTFCFKPSETQDAAALINALLEDEREKGYSVPDFGENFLENLTRSTENFPAGFNFKDLHTAVRFIEVVLDKTTSSNNAVALSKFLST